MDTKKDKLITVYHPITSKPFRNQSYTELQPCTALAPYIRCFWGTDGPMTEKTDKATIVIPDTCMDIIFHFDKENKLVDSGFCVIDERPYSVSHAEDTSFIPLLQSGFMAGLRCCSRRINLPVAGIRHLMSICFFQI